MPNLRKFMSKLNLVLIIEPETSLPGILERLTQVGFEQTGVSIHTDYLIAGVIAEENLRSLDEIPEIVSYGEGELYNT
jgi:hypothetical protein